MESACQICKRRYDASFVLPLFIPCGDTYCFQCLFNMTIQSPHLQTCQICNAQYSFTLFDIKNLPINKQLIMPIESTTSTQSPIFFTPQSKLSTPHYQWQSFTPQVSQFQISTPPNRQVQQFQRNLQFDDSQSILTTSDDSVNLKCVRPGCQNDRRFFNNIIYDHCSSACYSACQKSLDNNLNQMYIGPWQEFKLAQVIRMKNDIYTGEAFNRKPVLNQTALSRHNRQYEAGTPSNRSISSEPQQRHPVFDIDRYHKQWQRIEHLITRSEADQDNNRRPPVPRRDSQIRRRQPKSIHQKRIEKMKKMYGIQKQEEDKTPPLPPIHPQTRFMVQQQENLDIIGQEKQQSIFKPNVSQSIFRARNTQNNYRSPPITHKQLQPVLENDQASVSPVRITKSPIIPSKGNQSRFTSHNNNPIVQQSIDSEVEDQVDGLLQWVNDLPEDISTSDNNVIVL